MTSISIAMATFDGERYLGKQLESLAAQTHLPLELQIGDDGSTDETEDIVRSFAASAPFPVHFHKNTDNLGYGENFLQTAQRCSGEWIAFCDQDDVWFPSKLAVCASEISQRPNFSLVVHPVVVETDGAPGRTQFPQQQKRRVTAEPFAHEPFWSVLGWAQVFNRKLLGFDPSWRAPTIFTNVDSHPHDSWIALLSNALGGIVEVDEPLGIYRRHTQTVTSAAKGGSSAINLDFAGIGADHYAHVAQVARRTAEAFQILAARCPEPSSTLKLSDGAQKFGRVAELHQARADLYRSQGSFSRLVALGKLVRQRAYAGELDGAFSKRSFLKDVVFTGGFLRGADPIN